MKFRRTGSTSIAALVAAGACALLLVAVIGSAQAAATKKVYDATVHVTGGAVTDKTATLTLTLKNDATSNQTLGSANFTAPAGITFPANPVVRDADVNGWTAAVVGSDVQFRSTSNALPKGQSVSADVKVNISQSTCGDALWKARAKQSNDFSGNPGNDFQFNANASNLLPLGSFIIDGIGTTVSGQFVPQILVTGTTVDNPVTLTAYDVCGEVDAAYGSHFDDKSMLAPDPGLTPARLVNADTMGIKWTSGDGSAAVVPTSGNLLQVETDDVLVVSDDVSGIDASSDPFDVVEKICTTSPTACEWDNPNKKFPIHVEALVSQAGASLGIGFNETQNFSCGSGTEPLGSTLIYIAPHDYPAGVTQTVTFTYDKRIPGTSGSTSAFKVCVSKDNGESWNGPLGDCGSAVPPLPCVEDRGRDQGNLFITLKFDPHADPLGGIT